MKLNFSLILSLFISTIFLSCESEHSKNERLAHERRDLAVLDRQDSVGSVRLEEEKKEQDKTYADEQIALQVKMENERREEESYNKYINNTLSTGATPYSQYFGNNKSCNEYGCSQIKVLTSNSDVIVTIKKNGNVIRHAFIQAGDNYTFSFPNGTYQAFFYYGKGWNPEKEMKNGAIRGGFISKENFGKDDAQSLENNTLKYELILQQNGNFSTKPSNPEEAL